MEEQWDIMDFKTLLYNIKNGDISIQDPIHINNQTHDIQHNISFLDYLLKYKNIHKQNLYLTLSNIYGLFCAHLDEISENETIQQMKSRIFKEWYREEDNTLFDNIQQYGGDMRQTDLLVNQAHKSFDNVSHLSRIEENLPININLTSNFPLKTEFTETIQFCKKTTTHLRKKVSDIENILDMFQNFHIEVFIDLSIKHKSLYLRLKSNETGIPEKIHIIYSNFVYIHNLLHKHTIHQLKILQKMETDLTKKCSKINELQNNMLVVAHMGDEGVLEDGPKDINSTSFY